jgi:hypothetical protein
MANLSTDATLPTNAATGNIDFAQLTAIVNAVSTTVLRQVLVIGDPITGANKASVVPDEPQGWEAGMVANVIYARQLRDLNETQMRILAELQNLVTTMGGMPVTEKQIG